MALNKKPATAKLLLENQFSKKTDGQFKNYAEKMFGATKPSTKILILGPKPFGT